MSIRVGAYLGDGLASGTLAGPGALRDSLETGTLELAGVTWEALGTGTRESVGPRSIVADDVLVVIADDEPELSIHSTWHRVHLETGPYLVEGDLATMPGFDPGRALTRPSGTFLPLRDVRLSLLDRPGSGVDVHGHALVNRYAVERLQADLMLGFFFPGAAIEATDIQPERV